MILWLSKYILTCDASQGSNSDHQDDNTFVFFGDFQGFLFKKTFMKYTPKN